MRVFWSDGPSAKSANIKATVVDVSMLSIAPLVRAIRKRKGLLLPADTTRCLAAREVRDWREEIAADGPRWQEMKQIGVAEAVSRQVG